MDEIRVMQILFEDISRLELPPISEKVLVAIREKKQKIAKNSLIYSVTEKEHKSFPTKYLFAAMLTLLAVSVPIIVVLTHKASVSNAPNCPVLPNSNETVSTLESQVVSMANNETTLDRIKLKQIYGEVTLSNRPEKELETLLVTYSKESHIYEDNQYIYNFDSQGKLIEMRKLIFPIENESPVGNEIIRNKVANLMNIYFCKHNSPEYAIDISENQNTFPHWIAICSKGAKNNSQVKIRMEFNESGTLYRLISIGTENSLEKISKEQAVEIALQEIRKSKYNISPFKNEDVDITVEVRNKNNEIYYFVAVDNILRNELTNISVYFEININTGKIMHVEN